MRFGLKLALTIGLVSVIGRSAEAQARGSLQASATVIDTRQGFEALTAVRQAVTNSSMETPRSVAVVTTAKPAAKPRTIVVTVDFSRN